MANDDANKVAALDKKIQAMIKKNALERKLLEAAKQSSKKLDAEIKKTKKELAGEAD